MIKGDQPCFAPNFFQNLSSCLHLAENLELISYPGDDRISSRKQNPHLQFWHSITTCPMNDAIGGLYSYSHFMIQGSPVRCCSALRRSLYLAKATA